MAVCPGQVRPFTLPIAAGERARPSLVQSRIKLSRSSGSHRICVGVLYWPNKKATLKITSISLFYTAPSNLALTHSPSSTILDAPNKSRVRADLGNYRPHGIRILHEENRTLPTTSPLYAHVVYLANQYVRPWWAWRWWWRRRQTSVPFLSGGKMQIWRYGATGNLLRSNGNQLILIQTTAKMNILPDRKTRSLKAVLAVTDSLRSAITTTKEAREVDPALLGQVRSFRSLSRLRFCLLVTLA
jgi:hypothetical protein